MVKKGSKQILLDKLDKKINIREEKGRKTTWKKLQIVLKYKTALKLKKIKKFNFNLSYFLIICLRLGFFPLIVILKLSRICF